VEKVPGVAKGEPDIVKKLRGPEGSEQKRNRPRIGRGRIGTGLRVKKGSTGIGYVSSGSRKRRYLKKNRKN